MVAAGHGTPREASPPDDSGVIKSVLSRDLVRVEDVWFFRPFTLRYVTPLLRRVAVREYYI
eukprot:3434971-Pyramimonas_sp.AAC.1